MKRKVTIDIEGTLIDEKEEKIITNTEGEYILFDGKHVIKYKEPAENEYESNNTLIISPGLVEMSKNGESSTNMVFDLSKETESVYDTQFGCLCFQINTSLISLEEKQDGILLIMEYSLSNNGSHISENRICIEIRYII